MTKACPCQVWVFYRETGLSFFLVSNAEVQRNNHVSQLPQTDKSSVSQQEGPSTPRRVYCLSEDRPGAEIGLRLAIVSLRRYCPEARVFLYRPGISAGFRKWLLELGGVEIEEGTPKGARSWSCKPQAMLPLLSRGFDEVVWLDSDILVERCLDALVDPVSPDVLVIARDTPVIVVGEYTIESRTLGWGLEVGRRMPLTLNSCFMRVTRHHVSLMQAWKELMDDPRYVCQQELPLVDRKVGFISDQEVLNALLGSLRYAEVPMYVLGLGSELIHSAGALSFSFGDRLRCIGSGRPYLIHAVTGKPWVILNPAYPRNRRDRLTQLCSEVSPYVRVARRYRDQLPSEESQWLRFRTIWGRLLDAAALGWIPLAGWPLLVLVTCLGKLSTTIRSVRAGRQI